MTHRPRRRENLDLAKPGGGGRCPEDGKVRYLTRSEAKRAARRIKGRDGRLNAYQCGDFWHLGHLPRSVVRGRQTRDDLDDRHNEQEEAS